VRFNTQFLLMAAVVTAAACWPMALSRESGFVWTAFLLPAGLGFLAATQVEQQSELQFHFQKRPGSVVEISATGPSTGWLMRFRMILAGMCLSVVVGPPMLHQVDPEPLPMWVPIVACFALMAAMLLGCSMRRIVRVEERQLVTEYRLFGWRYWPQRPWQVRDGDYLMTVSLGDAAPGSRSEFRFGHVLTICRGRQRAAVIACYCSSSRDGAVPGMEMTGHLVAQLVNVPYEGYDLQTLPAGGTGRLTLGAAVS
jgi:hypothetical protein